VSLSAATGDIVWAKSLAGASEQFVDVDTTPAFAPKGDVAYVSSYSGGLYALDTRDGTVRWRLSIEGAGDVTAAEGRLYFVAPRFGLHAAHPDGHVLWRQGLSEAGDLTHPMVIGQYLVFSGSRAGMFVVNGSTGELLEIFNPGHGVCASPTWDPVSQRLFVLSNGGSLYALNLN
jgi:outer membrane protein assembly factor BamB